GNKRQAPEAIKLARQIEATYPDAQNLHEVRGFIVRMAATLAEQTAENQWWQMVDDTANRMLQGDPQPEVRTFARYFQVKKTIATSDLDGEAVDKAINNYVESFKGTPAAAQAMIMGITLAIENQRRDLVEPMADTLEEKFLTRPGVAAFLKQQLKRDISFVGEPFEATLTRLDGTKLNLPEDLEGKVVVIDFWATWCGPCIGSLPHMKEFYAEYKDKGVEIVGISLDRPGKIDHLKEFAKERGLDWIHTYSGEFRHDPTARRYGVSGIPSVWVLDKQGRIYSENAGGREGEVVDEILAGRTATGAAGK
ncbi:MAG: TlpA family protein disulfide reductase, partial [Phycisphaerae bacterium]|nr:TlpA family protein disulfide reductase [Phycisphaerae bacterium]